MKPLIFVLLSIVVQGAAYAQTDAVREFKQIQDDHRKAVAAALEPVNRRYRDALQQLQRRAAQANDLDLAMKIKSEIDGMVVAGKFTGAWLITFPNATNRLYKIDDEGNVDYIEERGRPMDKHCKITKIGNDSIIDFGDEYVQRISRAGDTLSVEHFNPRTLYPNSPPNLRGIGQLKTK